MRVSGSVPLGLAAAAGRNDFGRRPAGAIRVELV
jgi:hypothetical protein